MWHVAMLVLLALSCSLVLRWRLALGRAVEYSPERGPFGYWAFASDASACCFRRPALNCRRALRHVRQ
eukprot:6290014-Pyramimonas_sp.AAC.1